MRYLILIAFVMSSCVANAGQSGIDMPYSKISAPVVHEGRYHVLSCGGTYVVLDGLRGMTISMLGNGSPAERGISAGDAVITGGGMFAALSDSGGTIEIGQEYDPSPRLMIIDEGPGRTAARVYFSLCSEDGIPYGSGTLDLYVYEGRVFLVPSLFIDYTRGAASVSKAGFGADIPGEYSDLIVGGAKLLPSPEPRFIPFGGDDEGFEVTVNNAGRASMRIGWLRNRYPAWMYMRNIAENPETDELYEKWPPWITQRGNPLAWKVGPRSGLFAVSGERGVKRLEFLWARNDSLEIPRGGYRALNGVMAVFLGPNSSAVRRSWMNHSKPMKPAVRTGGFKYYNEFEGVYEIDSMGGDIDVAFDNFDGEFPRSIFVRIWNLDGKGGYEFRANNKPIPFALYNDGDIVEDPMVSVVKEASGPARFAGVSLVVGSGSRTRLTMRRGPGIQLVYQMYSGLETLEAWCDTCNDSPLFRFHVTRGELYRATLPGREDYAFFKLPLYWMKNGINPDTFMNHTRGFSILANGPDELQFGYVGVNLQGTGLSDYTVTVPYERDCLTLEVRAKFTALDDGFRWSSLEYCDLYPFESVYRRDFHYDDVIFLDESGKFDRVGTGAWSGGFETVEEPERLGYHAEPVGRDGPGSRTPSPSDGTVWILGNNTDRGNILYRRGNWRPSPGSRSVFSLCNAWVDVHNTVVDRRASSPGEAIHYTVEVFPGAVPPLDELNSMYRKAAGGAVVKQVEMVNYSLEGVIEGFVVK